jgi:hypothetical protein
VEGHFYENSAIPSGEIDRIRFATIFDRDGKTSRAAADAAAEIE